MGGSRAKFGLLFYDRWADSLSTLTHADLVIVEGQIVPQDERSSESPSEINEFVQEHVEGREKVSTGS